MNIHFIAIGGSVMHNLAINLHKRGNRITGSDDEIFEPARCRLKNHGLLPSSIGWNTGNIHPGLDAVILGMHARGDNPELLRAKELGIRIFSFPEYLYEQTKNKKRIVIAGSHGKTTVTSMIMHVLKNRGFSFDYMAGSIIEGFDTMVELNDTNEIAVFEGDEYLTSPMDPRPKFHLYKPHIGLITGIAWDHMNVFPTFDNYLEQFRIFSGMISETLVYFDGDPLVAGIAKEQEKRIMVYPYHDIPVARKGKASVIKCDNTEIVLSVFGSHNMQNLAGAMQVCKLLGLREKEISEAMTTFRGAAKRQEHLAGNDLYDVYLDFAHAPSKVKATVEAFRQQFPGRILNVILELHTFSSLNAAFIPQYKNTLEQADNAIVFYDPEVINHKKLPMINTTQVRSAFNREDLIIINKPREIETAIMDLKQENSLLLIMTSGNLSGLDIPILAKEYVTP